MNINETFIQNIQKNEKLMIFCNKILTYNFIFDNEVSRSMFFVSLISADCLVDEHQCDETIKIATFILDNIDLFILEDDIKDFVIKSSKDAIEIAKRDKKEFQKINRITMEDNKTTTHYTLFSNQSKTGFSGYDESSTTNKSIVILLN